MPKTTKKFQSNSELLDYSELYADRLLAAADEGPDRPNYNPPVMGVKKPFAQQLMTFSTDPEKQQMFTETCEELDARGDTVSKFEFVINYAAKEKDLTQRKYEEQQLILELSKRAANSKIPLSDNRSQ